MILQAGLELPKAQICLAMGSAELDPPVGPHPGLVLTYPHLQGGG